MPQEMVGARDVWDEIFFSAGRSIVEPDLETQDKDILISIVGGGTDAARLVFDGIPAFNQSGQPAFEQALPFVEVFAMAMVSRWVRHVCDQNEEFDRQTMWARLTKDVLGLFDGLSEERYEESRLMDMQFNALMDSHENRDGKLTSWMWQEAGLILLLAGRALGTPFLGKLTSPPMPVAEAYELAQGTGIVVPTDIHDLTKTSDSLTASEAGMYASFNALQKDHLQQMQQQSERRWWPWGGRA